jgi:hypothetical protein
MLHYHLFTLTADPIPSTQIHVQENRVQNYDYIKQVGVTLFKATKALRESKGIALLCF